MLRKTVAARFVLVVSEKASLDLIPVDRPCGIGQFLPSVEFQVWSGADRFHHCADDAGLAAVGRSTSLYPGSHRTIAESQLTADSQKQEFVRDSPIIPHSNFVFDPH